ncbi:MAG TPA: TylF/MycF/NovP-related O-methyltransferase [Terriglobales bacterium]|nr:TylF/MycF/NovP-related O-methyltransferase [Terriglobales bacterium]
MERIVTADTVQQVLRELAEINVMAAQVEWPQPGVPDRGLYRPYARGWATFAPWHADPCIATMVQRVAERGKITLVDTDRAWTLACAFRQTRVLAGEVWEAGVYQGGSARLFKALVQEAQAIGQPTLLRLFDSFEGLPPTDNRLDLHHGGDFNDTSLEQVMELVGPEAWIDFRKGWIPATFAGLENSRIRFAHIDVDLFQPILDCCEFIYPRLVPGGMLVFDDYGVPSCPGARAAVDQFFRGRPETPFPLVNGQCVVTRHCSRP